MGCVVIRKITGWDKVVAGEHLPRHNATIEAAQPLINPALTNPGNIATLIKWNARYSSLLDVARIGDWLQQLLMVVMTISQNYN